MRAIHKGPEPASFARHRNSALADYGNYDDKDTLRVSLVTERRKSQHCDTRQGNRDFSRNPADPMHRVEDLIRYEGDGRIASDNQGFDDELNKVLNLNAACLLNKLKAALDAFVGALPGGGRWDEKRWKDGCGVGTENRTLANWKPSAWLSFTGYGNGWLGLRAVSTSPPGSPVQYSS